MKIFIGRIIGLIGALLWQNGGFNDTDRYEDLKMIGKVGYNMVCAGLNLMGLSIDDLENIVENHNSTIN